MSLFNDITVVVQGPVQSFDNRSQEEGITEKCLNSIREHLPGAFIILSTWHNQDLTRLDYDELVLSDDPGQNIRKYSKDGTAKKYNNNRQIVSSLAGLKKVKTKYALKLRSDNYLTSNNFVQVQKQYAARSSECLYLDEHVVVSDVFTRKYAKGVPVTYHMSDFFYFGLTQDVRTMWDIELIKDFVPTPECPYHEFYPEHLIDCNQMFLLAALRQFDSRIDVKYLHDYNAEQLVLCEKIYANNFIICSPETLGLGLGDRFKKKVRIAKPKGRAGFWYEHEWLDIYNKYCLGIHNGMSFKKVKSFLFRLVHVFPSRVENYFRMLKK